MIDVALLWVFASVVILLGQCVIVWKAFQIFKAVVASEREQQDKVVQRVEQLFAEQRDSPPFDVESLMEKMQQTYLEHLEAVRSKSSEHFDKLLEQHEEAYRQQVEVRDEQIKWLTEETRRIRRALSPQLLATLSAERDVRATPEGQRILDKGSGQAFHRFWLSHDLLWAMTVDPVEGIGRALEHLGPAGLEERKIGVDGPTYAAALKHHLEQAEQLDDSGDPKERQTLNDALAQITLKLAEAVGA